MRIAEFEKEWGWARSLTKDLLVACSEADLLATPLPTIGPLWKIFRHVFRVQENYLAGIETGVTSFGFEGTHYIGSPSKSELLALCENLGMRQNSLVSSSRSDILVHWEGEKVSREVHLVRLLSHETLHHGQLILIWKALGNPFPKSWSAWGEE
ncbi:MAG: DinB family protein [Bdellovibrionales bacterium]|nr:DinB family protein [Bdellovibrionales bacterium]